MLTKEVIIYCIKEKIMAEFVRQKLDVKFKEEIEAWFIYLDQQEFGEKLEKQILEEIERYMSTNKTTEEIVNEMIKEPKWEIEYIKNIEVNYFFKSVLGYA